MVRDPLGIPHYLVKQGAGSLCIDRNSKAADNPLTQSIHIMSSTSNFQISGCISVTNMLDCSVNIDNPRKTAARHSAPGRRHHTRHRNESDMHESILHAAFSYNAQRSSVFFSFGETYPAPKLTQSRHPSPSDTTINSTNGLTSQVSTRSFISGNIAFVVGMHATALNVNRSASSCEQ